MVKKRKKIVFEDYEENYANLKIRLRHDKIKQSEFFTFLLQKYINCDPAMMIAVEELKHKLARYGKRKITNTSKEIEQGDFLLKELGITDSEKNQLFDLIEKTEEDYE